MLVIGKMMKDRKTFAALTHCGVSPLPVVVSVRPKADVAMVMFLIGRGLTSKRCLVSINIAVQFDKREI